MKFKDKFGVTIDIGDIVCCSSPYGSDVFVGTITNITKKSVVLKYFSGVYYPDWYGNRKVVSPYGQLNAKKVLDRAARLNNWGGYTSTPERRLIILKKVKNENSRTKH